MNIEIDLFTCQEKTTNPFEKNSSEGFFNTDDLENLYSLSIEEKLTYLIDNTQDELRDRLLKLTEKEKQFLGSDLKEEYKSNVIYSEKHSINPLNNLLRLVFYNYPYYRYKIILKLF